MELKPNQQAFLALVRAGLWEQDVQFFPYGKIDFSAIFKLAEEQSVIGLVTAGLEHVKVTNVPKGNVLEFVGVSLKIEQRNTAMNIFLNALINKLREKDIYAILVKGQGLAQCYERPLWRNCGDIDLLLSTDNYIKAKALLVPLASYVEQENMDAQHLGMTIDNWMVELHGSLRSCCLHQMDRVIDDVQKDVFYGGNVRSWTNEGTLVFLPSPDNDIFFVFTHIIKHFFHEGIGLRQICDWCRLLWTAKDNLDIELLESRLKTAGIITEWKAFAALAVDELGMPVKVMPLYNAGKKWRLKAKRIMSIILMTGNFGHNRDLSHYHRQPLLKQKAISFSRHTNDAMSRLMIFPKDTIIVWLRMFFVGIKAVIKL